MQADFPVVIAGAGPAGATASLILSDFKIPHLLLDKAVFPRDKICGDAVSGKMLDVIAKVRPVEVTAFSETIDKAIISYGMQFVAPSGKSVDIAFPKPKGNLPIGFVSPRLDFDDFLFGMTSSDYATRWQDAMLKDIKRIDGGLELSIQFQGTLKTIKTPLILGGDGSRSIVKKTLLGDEVDENHYCGGIRAYYKNVSGMHPQNYLELHFFNELLPGYFWIFPLPNGRANVGMGMLTANISKKKVNLRKELLNLVQNHPSLKHRFENAELEGNINGWGLPLGSKRRPLSGDNFILTGDAASLIDPFTGEGIGNAGVSGLVAARIAKQAIEANNYNADFLKTYDKAVYDKLWDELQLSHKIQKLSSIPWLFNFVVNRITSNRKLQEVFTNMFVDMDLRSELKNPLFYLRLLFNK